MYVVQLHGPVRIKKDELGTSATTATLYRSYLARVTYLDPISTLHPPSIMLHRSFLTDTLRFCCAPMKL